MSSRLFKKVVKEQEQQLHQEEDEQLKDNESESPDSAPRSSINPFDLLNDGDDDPEPDPDPDQVFSSNLYHHMLLILLSLLRVFNCYVHCSCYQNLDWIIH